MTEEERNAALNLFSSTPTSDKTPSDSDTVSPAKTKKRTSADSVKTSAVKAKTLTKDSAAVEKPVKKKKKWVKKAKPDTENAQKKVREPYSKFDFTFFTIVLILLVFGVIMMFSASYATAYRRFGDSFYYVSRQALYAGFGVLVMIGVSFFDYRILQNKKILYLLGGVAVLLMVAVKLGGVTQGNAERWLDIGPVRFQPSEVLKFAVIVICAYLAQKNYEKRKLLKCGFLPFSIVMILGCGLVIIQPHLSATIIIFILVVVMMFVAGVPVKHLVLLGVFLAVIAAIVMTVLIAKDYTYFYSRFQSWLDPESDVTGKTYQTYQSLVTIGSGGMFGLGLGNSRQKYSYLPATENDFIFSVICEELGFVGAMVVIILFVLLVARGFFIAGRARDKFGMLLAVGITLQIGLQALLNIAVVTNSVPNTGITLPFFSYGGTALLMQMGEMGILLSVSRKAEIG